MNKTFDSIWSYGTRSDVPEPLFIYDNKAYMKYYQLYWRGTNKYIRDLDSEEIRLIHEYEKQLMK